MKILFIGDIVGKPGRTALKKGLPQLRSQFDIDLVIANAENAAGGFGITEQVGKEILALGVDVMTSGNHIWDKKDAIEYIAKENRLLRPANYPDGVPGHGTIIVKTSKGEKAAVLNISGRVFMNQLDSPFTIAKKQVALLKKETNIIIVDIHAEATSEKLAIGFYLDGEVSAVIGTHTHVQTADEQILPKGTAYLTDVGMTGPTDSILGVEKGLVLSRFLTHIPVRFETANGESVLSCALIDIDAATGRSTAIERIQLKFP
ncbi:MAG: TIGR00282 family metallophosphoesterase [Thermodesulfovibrionia bacterium]|nr:TIGR00282 family metallophosphoesterase [Thermodesulfovibrionia bacterium]